MRMRIRRERARSGNAPCDVCGERDFLVEHHIRGRKVPRPNHPSNLCHVCSNCHARIHRGSVVLEGWMMTDVGKRLFWHLEGEESLSGDDAHPHIIMAASKDSLSHFVKDHL